MRKTISAVWPDLVTGCLTVMHYLLLLATKKKNWHANKAVLAHYVHTNIPHNLRQKLLDRILYDWRVYDTVTYRMLELLFSSTTTSVQLSAIRTFYRDAFVNLLPRLTGLLDLKILDPVWTFSRRQLGVTYLALSKMTHLRVLILQHCGHDALLAAAGAHCPHLKVVDVRGSRSVSDEGVWSLISVRRGGVPLIPDEPVVKDKKEVIHFGKCFSSSFKSLASKMSILLALSEARDPLLLKHMRTDGESILCWSKCIKTIVYVDLRCTKVSEVGVKILSQALMPNTRIRHDNSGGDVHYDLISGCDKKSGVLA